VALDADRFSLLGCFQILKWLLPECNISTPRTFEEWYQGLWWEMQLERTDDELRRNRANPRVSKRKVWKSRKKRPEHRHLLPVKKTFTETMVTPRWPSWIDPERRISGILPVSP
jgi:hypothetical protein